MDKTEKFDKIKYDNEYIKANLDIIKFSVPKGEKEKIKKYAEQHGENISSLLRRAIRLICWVDSNPGKIPPSDKQIIDELNNCNRNTGTKEEEHIVLPLEE